MCLFHLATENTIFKRYKTVLFLQVFALFNQHLKKVSPKIQTTPSPKFKIICVCPFRVKIRSGSACESCFANGCVNTYYMRIAVLIYMHVYDVKYTGL